MREALARIDPGAILALLRDATGLSQLDMANLVDGWSQSTVSHIERGKRDTLYDIREFLRFAGAVDMPREALLPLVLGRANATLGGDGGAHPDDPAWTRFVTHAETTGHEALGNMGLGTPERAVPLYREVLDDHASAARHTRSPHGVRSDLRPLRHGRRPRDARHRRLDSP